LIIRLASNTFHLCHLRLPPRRPNRHEEQKCRLQPHGRKARCSGGSHAAGEGSQQRGRAVCIVANGADEEAVPSAKRCEAFSGAAERQGGHGIAIARDGNDALGPGQAHVGEQRQPVQPVKRRAGRRTAKQRRQHRVGLRFGKISVIDRRNQDPFSPSRT
jgi:hypothetical protein